MAGSFLKKTGLTVAAAFVVAMCMPNALNAQQVDNDAALELEFVYLERLETAGFANIAEAVLKDIETKFPGAKVQIKIKKLAQLLARGKFDEARAQIAKEPNQDSVEVWGMKCSMADYYFAFGKYDESFAEYKSFFNKFSGNPPEELRKIYNESYYKFAQMLLMLDRDEEALKAYEAMRTGKSGMPTHMQRQIAFENAELLVRMAEENPAKKDEYIKRAAPIVENILWTQDLWFARAVALLAHIKVVNNDLDGASDVIQDNMPMIKQMDKQLMEMGKEQNQDFSRLSPLAESRYLVGQMLHNEAIRMVEAGETTGANADKIKKLLLAGNPNAMTEFANVYIRYPASSWAPDAGLRIEQIKQMASDLFGLSPKLNITEEQRATVAQKQFDNASLSYNQNQFEQAIEAYLLVINQYPEEERSIIGIGNMIRSACKLQLTAKDAETKAYYKLLENMLVGHLAERFHDKEKIIVEAAGNEMLGIAQFYRDNNMSAQANVVQNLFYENYSSHSLAAQLLMGDAEKLYGEESYEEALKLYEILAKNYKKSPLSYDAIKRMADCYSKLGDAKNEIKARELYYKRIEAQKKPSHELLLAKYLYCRSLKAFAVAEMKAGKLALELEKKAGNDQVEEEKAPEGEEATEDQAQGEEVKKQLTPIQRISQAQKYLSVVIKELGVIEKWLSPETIIKYQASTKESEMNQSILESLYFDKAHAYSSLYSKDADKAVKYKLSAIEQYRKLREKFPESKNMPMVLMQLGTLLSSVKQGDEAADAKSMEEAQAIFAELAEKYPDSNEAKNAHFVQGKTLIELGYRTQGVAALKKMFENAKQYSAGQIYSAAEELYESKDYATALEGFELAIEKAEGNESIITPCTYGKAKVLHAQKKYEEAVKVLDEFQEKYPKSYLLLDVLDLMSVCGVEAARNESDVKKRIELFNNSMKAIKLVRQYRGTTAKAIAEAELQMGRILETYAEIAKKWDDTKRADDYMGRASSQYQKFIMSANVEDAEILPIVEEAYARDIPISISLKLFDSAKEDCDTYISLFPNGKYLSKIMLYKTQAEQGLMSQSK